jgi:hypothetical protein
MIKRRTKIGYDAMGIADKRGGKAFTKNWFIVSHSAGVEHVALTKNLPIENKEEINKNIKGKQRVQRR